MILPSPMSIDTELVLKYPLVLLLLSCLKLTFLPVIAISSKFESAWASMCGYYDLDMSWHKVNDALLASLDSKLPIVLKNLSLIYSSLVYSLWLTLSNVVNYCCTSLAGMLSLDPEDRIDIR